MTPVLNTDGFVQLLIGLVTPQMLLLTNFSLLDLLICQAVVSLLVTLCVPIVNHLYISILTPVAKIFQVSWQGNIRTRASYRRGINSPLQRLLLFENTACGWFFL